MNTDIDPLIRTAMNILPETAGLTKSVAPDGGTIFWQIALQLVLIVFNAIFACAEIAVLSVNDNKLAKLASEGNKRAVRLARLTNQPARFLATIQVAITLSGFLGSAFAAENFAGYISALFDRMPYSVSVIIITILLSYITLVFGELVPKRVAMKKAEQLALGMSGLIWFISKIFSPLVWLLTGSTNCVLRLMHIDPNQNDSEVTEEEIRMMIDAGSEKGTIDTEEKEIIQNVFEFDDLTADEIATHRTDIVILWMDESDEEWERLIHESRFSQYPVCEDSVDNVVGILNAKDYFRLKDRSRESIMENAVRQAYFVPEGVRADVLFRDMKRNRKSFAVVLDEYGGVSGILTMNDLVEKLVGDLDDEDDVSEPQQEITKTDEDTWCIFGSATLDDVAEQLDVELPVDEFDTFGGFVFSSLGRIPDDGTTFELDVDNLHISVLEIREHRIEKTMVHVDRKIQDEDDDD